MESQNEVQRNMALCVLLQRLEERASEGVRILSEQVESNQLLKLQVHQLQKNLEDKDHSLAHACQTVAALKTDLRYLHQQLQSHQNCRGTIQEVTEWLQDGEANPNVMREEDDLLMSVVRVKEEDGDDADEGHIYGSDHEHHCGRAVPPTQQIICPSAVIKTEDPTEQSVSTASDNKSELLQEQDGVFEATPVLGFEMINSPPDLVSVEELKRLPVTCM
ncbi:uncharacterized protein LOC134458330 [Engraulis encrasicolus]|uniref:uncharacterized protein LOC134458330 n=1 Tax=Engraulis encrasicolus TaxID=184585 RepID=UPI002FD55805